MQRENEQLRRENELLREALSIKNELEALKQSQKRLRARRKSSSRSTLNRTGTPLSYDSPKPVEPVPLRKSVDDWYNDVDVSVSSTGSDIRRRLKANIPVEPTPQKRETFRHERQFEDVSPIAYYTENEPPRHPQSFQMHTPQVKPAEENSYAYMKPPSWINRNPHLAGLHDASSRLGAIQLPPLFRNPMTISTAELGTWSIPPPVLYGLGRRQAN